MSHLTLYDKIWNEHLVSTDSEGRALLYIDRHLVHEVTSPQAFDGLRLAGRDLWRRDSILATADHNVPTTGLADGIQDPLSRNQVETLTHNCGEHGIQLFGLGHRNQGIVHIIGPELGFTLPGITLVCGDSHTSTHGALGALAFGAGTSEIEHVMATQCLFMPKLQNMRVDFRGRLPADLTAKDMVLALIGHMGTAGGTGAVIEYAGEAVRALSIEGRMTICNMTVEGGARAGLVAVDDKTLEYVCSRPRAPRGALREKALDHWRGLNSDEGAKFDREVVIDVAQIKPQVTWGTSPEMVASIDQRVPDPADEKDPAKADDVRRALDYMDVAPGTAMTDIPLDKVFIGSCTNARIEDLRQAAAVVDGRKVAASIRQALVVPGSGMVKKRAEEEGLDRIFRSAGFEWREPGCSMCLGMNNDRLDPGERCASTSNRNFEGRQGRGGRTHLASPAMVAAAAIAGHFVDIRSL